MAKKGKKIKQKAFEDVSIQVEENGLLKRFRFEWFDVFVFVAILIFSVSVWWPTRFLPYHWDSASFVVNAARDLMNRNFSPLVLLEFKTAHQPGLMLMLGIAWKIFGENRLVSHILMLPSLPILMLSTYFLGKKLYSRNIGVIAGFLVGTLPLTVSEYGMISPDLWMAAIASAALALWFWERRFLGVILLCAAVLVKGNALILIIPMFWYSWSSASDKKNFDFKLYLLPVATLMLWFFYNMSVTGWLFNPPEIPLLLPNSMNMFVKYLVFVFQNVFGSHMRWVLTILAAVGAYFAWQNKRLEGMEYENTKGLVITLFAAIIYMTMRGGFVEPVSIFVMPILILVSLWFVSVGFAKFEWFGESTNIMAVGVVVLLASLMQWQPKIEAPKDYVFNRAADLSYQDLIYVGRAAAIFSQINFPGTKIYGGYPEYYQLTEPYQGYATKVLDFDTCDHFDGKSEKPVLIYLHPYHPSQQNCRVLLDQFELQPVKRFESNGAWTEIYAYSATGSAETENAK